MAAGASAGARVVFLDDAVKPLQLEASEAGLELNWSADAIGGSPGQGEATVFSGGLRALRPPSPVHLKARRGPAGDVAFTWVRRGRIDADSWLGGEIPLGESRERYRVEILRGPAVVRSGEVSAPVVHLRGRRRGRRFRRAAGGAVPAGPPGRRPRRRPAGRGGSPRPSRLNHFQQKGAQMPEKKAWYLSRTVWSAAVAVLASLAGLAGVDVTGAEQSVLVNSILQIASAGGAVAAIAGRLAATKRLL